MRRSDIEPGSFYICPIPYERIVSLNGKSFRGWDLHPPSALPHLNCYYLVKVRKVVCVSNEWEDDSGRRTRQGPSWAAYVEGVFSISSGKHGTFVARVPINLIKAIDGALVDTLVRFRDEFNELAPVA